MKGKNDNENENRNADHFRLLGQSGDDLADASGMVTGQMKSLRRGVFPLRRDIARTRKGSTSVTAEKTLLRLIDNDSASRNTDDESDKNVHHR